tara:strand:+ start:39 stop:707 length:669 start_codon:yes stop_codon:yes gene_type:complete
MHQQISKKILIYLFFLVLLGTVNNINTNKFDFPKIDIIKVSGLESENNLVLLKNIKNLNLGNIFFLHDAEIRNIINSNSLVEGYNVLKKYPSSLYIEINKTKFLARINNNGESFLIGSNGKLIKDDDKISVLPFVNGDPSINDFLKFKKIIDNSKFEYNDIKNLFFFSSKRWDIEINNEIMIKLPRKNPEQVIGLVFEIFNQNLDNIKTIDARVKNQIILND